MDDLNIMTSENAYELSLLALKQLMEVSPDTKFSIVKPDIDALMGDYAGITFEQVFADALNTQPGIKKSRTKQGACPQKY